ncbi:MAG: family 78 glycoside hydrolase catalytic domain [Clostridia bacterium]|nr:family 78 glycoside hydrolase catalytic domain [Clostridia bacterium]
MSSEMQQNTDAFGGAVYVKASAEAPAFSYTDPLPFFRKEFLVGQTFERAELCVQAPGFAKLFLNGKDVTEDIFISAISDYDKILWYHTYDVTALLRPGINTLGVIAGNGFLNESYATGWGFDSVPWRDAPQFLLCLRVDGKVVAASDTSWKCSRRHSHITFSHLRCGEYVDMRKYDTAWLEAGYDDSDWQQVLQRTRPITATLRPVCCQPVRECERIAPVSLKRTADGALIADFGKTISGYAELAVCAPRGTELLLFYAEELHEDGTPKHNGMDGPHYYPQTPFQHCRMITSGSVDRFKPCFFYAGFRYLRIEGLQQEPIGLCAIFTHQALERRAAFSCGNAVLNYIYNAGIQSTYSNLFWCLTDCPTREKLGWTNDAQASTEQVLINFDSVPLLEKWYEDIKASMFADGSLHGTVPAPDWAWGHNCGPVCDCLLFEMPYRVYLYTGRAEMLVEGLPYFLRYIAFLEQKIASGHCFTLGDWASNDQKSAELKALIARLYLLKAYDVTALACTLSGEDPQPFMRKAREAREAIAAEYLDPNGESRIKMQTAVAMLLAFGVTKSTAVLERQLVEIIARDGYQLRAGMVGFQYIYHVLSDIGKGEIAYRLLCESEPGYKTWCERGETTLWEEWNGKDKGSHNHHMYSGVIAWFFRALLGIVPTEQAPGFARLELAPLFIRALQHASGHIDTVRGRIAAKWAYREGGFEYIVTLPKGIEATFNGIPLTPGENAFFIPDGE